MDETNLDQDLDELRKRKTKTRIKRIKRIKEVNSSAGA